MNKSDFQKKVVWIEVGAGFLLLLLFAFSVWLLIRGSDQKMREELLHKTEYISQAINANDVKGLSGTIEDQNSFKYQFLKEQLQLARSIFPEIRFLYLMGQNDEGLIFIYVDSEPPGFPDESLPGDIYHEMTVHHSEMFSTQISQVIGPVEDIWGTWITALVPIINPINGNVEAIFGADIDSADWQTSVIKNIYFPIIIVFLFIVFIFVSLHYVLYRNQIPRTKLREKLSTYREIVFFLVLGIIVTTFISWFRFQNVSIIQEETFNQLANARSRFIISYFNNLEHIYIEGLNNFFESSQYVDLDEFSIYASALENDANVLAWGWFPELGSDQVDSFIAEMKATGVENYQIWEMDENRNKVEVAERPFYYPIAYIFPEENNLIAYGYDHGSDPIRLDAILQAKQSNLTIATDPTRLLQTIKGDQGILVYKHVHTEENEDRQNGFIQAIINMESLLDIVLGQYLDNKPMLYMDLFQIKAEDSLLLLASNSPADITERHQQSFLHDHPYSSLSYVQPIFAFGKVYAIVVHPGPAFTETYPNFVGWYTTVLGIVLTLLTTAIIYSFVSRRAILEKMVLARTEELHLSEQKYKNLAESTSAILWEYNIVQDRWTYVAPQVTEMMGWSPEDFTNLQFWIDHLHQDDKVWAPVFCATQTQRGLDHELEYRFLKPDGSTLWIRDVVSVEVKDDKPIMMRGYMLDITQKKKAEENQLLQSTALESSVNAIFITNLQGQIQWANPAFEKLTGYQRDEVIGKEPGKLLNSGAQSKEFYKDLWDTIISGNAWNGELINKRKDGSLYNEEMTITPVKNSNGDVTHFIAIKQDISDRKNREFELEALETINKTIRDSYSSAEMTPLILEQLMEIFHAEGSALVVLDSFSNQYHLKSAKGVFEGQLQQNLETGLSISGIVQKTGKPFFTKDIRKEKDVVWSKAYDITKSIICVPLFVEGQSIGNLRIGRSFEFTLNDLKVFTSIAEIVANAVHREKLRDETIKQIERLSTLRSIDQVITSIVDLRVVLSYILEQVTIRLNIDAAAIHLYNPVSHRLQYQDGYGFMTKEIEKTNVLIGEYYIGKVAINKKTIIKPSITAEDFPGGNLIKREHFVSYFATPVIAKGQIKGVLELFKRSYFNPDEDWINYFEILAGQTAIAIDNSQLFEGLQRSNFDLSLAYNATIEGWSRAMDLRDRETEGHTLRVTELTLQLARMIGINEEEIQHIRRGSLLHDMGKIGIPDNILHKPGPLSEEEWVLMRKHPIFAYEMLAPIDYLKKAIDIPYSHHERWDGSGYPRGLKGEQIPLVARIFAVVDVYDALTSDRPYRAAWSKEKAIKYILENSGIQFDPTIVDLFLKLINQED